MSQELMKQNIKKAQLEIERKKEAVKKGRMRQKYHFMPQTGWMNDPNGLIYFRGKYHMFFQYNPYGCFWDSMHWGHAVSDDMVHWEYLPLALAPSEEYDNHPKGGCFSGSAIEHDGKLFLMYTAASNIGRGNEQTQCIAWSEDGIHFQKYEGNPVITAPEGVLPGEFRDPKVWKHEDTFYMVCAASYHDRAQALLYRSEDMLHWSFFNVLAESRGEGGKMWECPDFYSLGDRYVLMYSPVGVGEHTSVYQVGDFDYRTGKFWGQTIDEMDWGFDYYAPQSFLTPDNRRIVMAWANEWEWMPHFRDWGATFTEGWCGYYNVTREVRLVDGRLQFVPIRELEVLRKNPGMTEVLALSEKGEEAELTAGNGESFELKFMIDLEQTSADQIELDLRCGKDKKTVCTFDLKNSELRVDLNNADEWSQGISRSILFLKGKKELDVHIFSDQISLEIFTNQYQNNHSSNIYPESGQNRMFIRAIGGDAVIRRIESYGLETCI